MNSINKLATLFAIVLSLTAVSSHGGEFDYSYTFHNGDVATGSFDGTLAGNLISDISNTTVTIDGYTVTGTILDESFSGIQYVIGGATVSLDGTQNNFLFINSDSSGYFGSITDGALGDFVQADDPFIFGNIVDLPINSSWSVTAVPEGGTTIAMLLSGIMGMACFWHRKPITRHFLSGN
jgi:hypothetical protein